MNSTTISWVGHFVEKQSQNSGQIPWFWAAFCSALVGLTGLVPILLLPKEDQKNTETNNNSNKTRKQASSLVVTDKNSNSPEEPKWLKTILSFAVGGLLGDVFLHLLPEAFGTVQDHSDSTLAGLCIIFGLLAFTCIEKMLQSSHSVGYLNLVANALDNFNHGLAVGAAFLVSTKVGFVTTGCILLHEIPHEVGDFAILIKSGFNRREAAKAQFLTALIGISGAFSALTLDFLALHHRILTLGIVPFTCGGFLHISLISVLPDLLESENLTDCGQCLIGIWSGIGTMYLASSI